MYLLISSTTAKQPDTTWGNTTMPCGGTIFILQNNVLGRSGAGVIARIDCGHSRSLEERFTLLTWALISLMAELNQRVGFFRPSSPQNTPNRSHNLRRVPERKAGFGSERRETSGTNNRYAGKPDGYTRNIRVLLWQHGIDFGKFRLRLSLQDRPAATFSVPIECAEPSCQTCQA